MIISTIGLCPCSSLQLARKAGRLPLQLEGSSSPVAACPLIPRAGFRRGRSAEVGRPTDCEHAPSSLYCAELRRAKLAFWLWNEAVVE